MAPPVMVNLFGHAAKGLHIVAALIVLYFAALAVYFRWLGRRKR